MKWAAGRALRRGGERAFSFTACPAADCNTAYRFPSVAVTRFIPASKRGSTLCSV